MIIDAHVFIRSQADVSDLLHIMDQELVDKAVLCPVLPTQDALDLVCRVQKDHPNRFFRLVRAGGHGVDVVSMLSEENCAGLLLHPWEDNYDLSVSFLEPMMQRLQALKKPVWIQAGYPWRSEAAQIGRFAHLYPDIPMLLTNGGQINISGQGQAAAMHLLKTTANTYLTSAGVYREDFLEEVMGDISKDRLLFGSNWPIFDLPLEIRRLQWAHVPLALKTRALGANLLSLLSFSN